MDNLKKEIERFKIECVVVNFVVKRLEEDKFCKDGEIKMLCDFLVDY